MQHPDKGWYNPDEALGIEHLEWLLPLWVMAEAYAKDGLQVGFHYFLGKRPEETTPWYDWNFGGTS